VSSSPVIRRSFVRASRQGPARRRLGGAGFTLLEILLAIAIIALIGTVLIGGSANLLSEQPATPDEVFDKAVQEARKRALKSEKEVRLVFKKDGDTKRFALVDSAAPPPPADGFVGAAPDPNAGVLAEFPVPNPGDLDVTFLPSGQKGGNSILIGGLAVETTTVPFATFYTDGTCTPFRAQFVKNGATHTIGIDPWTCAPVLKPLDANGQPLPTP
jgi:general secretion pathway protein H